MKFDLEIIKYFQVFDLSSFFPFYSLVSKFIELYTNFQINFILTAIGHIVCPHLIKVEQKNVG